MLCYIGAGIPSFRQILSCRLSSRRLQYDTIYLHALKSWQNGQLSLAHGTETKIKEKNKKTKTD